MSLILTLESSFERVVSSENSSFGVPYDIPYMVKSAQRCSTKLSGNNYKKGGLVFNFMFLQYFFGNVVLSISKSTGLQ